MVYQVEETGINDAGWVVTELQGEELSVFLTKGVTKGTRSSYASDWRAWTMHIEGMQEGAADIWTGSRVRKTKLQW